LLAAGFVEPETRATVDSYGTLRRTRAVAELLATRFRGPNEAGGLAVCEGWATADEVAAFAAELHAWGERPDAVAYQVSMLKKDPTRLFRRVENCLREVSVRS